MKYKVLIIILFFTFSSAALLNTGCTPEKRLTFMVGGAPNELAFWEALIAEFQEKTGVSVEMVRQSTDSSQRKQGILMSLRGRRPDPDVMLLDVAWIAQIAASNWLQDLKPYGIERQAFFEKVVELADTWKGQLIGLPLYIDGGLLYYRKDLLDKYGYDHPPETWNELTKMAVDIQNKEREQNSSFWGYAWQGAQYEGLICNALEVFVSGNGGLTDRDGKPVLTSDANKKMLQYMVDFIHKDEISPPNTFTDMKEEEARLLFHNGNALFQRNWPYAWGLHNADDSPVKGKVGMAPLPSLEGAASASTLGGWHIVVSTYSDMQEEAAEFLKFATSYDVQKRMSMTLGWNPGRMDVYNDEELLKHNPALSELKKIFTGAIPRPMIPWYSEISSVMQKHFSAALAQQISAEEALKRAQKEAETIIAEYGG